MWEEKDSREGREDKGNNRGNGKVIVSLSNSGTMRYAKHC